MLLSAQAIYLLVRLSYLHLLDMMYFIMILLQILLGGINLLYCLHKVHIIPLVGECYQETGLKGQI